MWIQMSCTESISALITFLLLSQDSAVNKHDSNCMFKWSPFQVQQRDIAIII